MRGADLRDRLVPDAGAGDRGDRRVPRSASRRVHGRNVRGQPASGPRGSTPGPSTQGLRGARGGDRNSRAGAARLHPCRRPRLRELRACRPRQRRAAGGSVCGPPRTPHTPHGRDAARGRSPGGGHARGRVVDGLLLRRKRRRGRGGQPAGGLLPAPPPRRANGDLGRRVDQPPRGRGGLSARGPCPTSHWRAGDGGRRRRRSCS
jgi:hypothetical protein